MANPHEHLDWDKPCYPQVGDLRIMSYGINAFYIFNSKQFSYKAAFIRNMVQKRRTGIFISRCRGHQDCGIDAQR